MESLHVVLTDVPLERLAVTVLFVGLAVSMLTLSYAVPAGLPWVGKKPKTLFAHTRAAMQSLTHVNDWLHEGYEKYSQQGKSYLFPSFGGRPEIILPNDSLKWLVNLPDHVASAGAAHFEQLIGDHAFTDSRLLTDPFHEHVLHRNLSRRLAPMMPHVWDEVQYQLDSRLGRDTDAWRDVPVMDTFMAAITALSNRLFVGLPLCRNDDFLACCSSFANQVGLSVALAPFVPRVLRPLVYPLLTLPNRFIAHSSRRFALPLVQDRLAIFAHNDAHPDDEKPLGDDYVTWHIRLARHEGRLDMLEPEEIAKRLLPVEFAAIHTTTFALVNVLFDLIGSDPKRGYLEGLREEAERVLAESQGVWSKQALAKMVRADSAIRESMRISAFMTRSVYRKVLAPQGVKTDEGWTAPYGSMLAIDLWSRHHDPNIYPDPDDFDAFRFSREVERAQLDPSPESHLRAARLSLTSTSEDFLPFGHGKHACPGRFLVNQEIKMMLACLLTRYDVQYLDSRPPNSFLGSSVLPPAKATMRVRRRAV